MATVNDAELIELYNANRSELFPALRRKGALTPLVVLLAVLSPLIAMVNDSIDPADARWGLESLHFVSPVPFATNDNSQAGGWSFAEQKPLAAALTGMSLTIPGLSPSIALSLVAFVCMVTVIILWHSLCCELVGSRFAFWSTALIACHGPFLLHVQSAAPTLLGVAFALGALKAFYSHVRDAEGIVSVRLMFAGISLGLCLLASGIAAVSVIAIGVILAVSMRFDTKGTSANGSSESRTHHRGQWGAMRSVLILAITAFAVGGWWVMMSAAEHGSEFWATWLSFERTFEMRSESSGGLSSVTAIWFRLVDMLGVLLVPALFGVWCLGRDLWQRSELSQRISSQLLAAWLSGSGVIWMVWLRRSPGPADVPDLMLMLPMTGCAALAIEQIVLRRYRTVVAVWLVCLAFIVPLWTNATRAVPVGSRPAGEWTTLISSLSVLAAFGILTTWLLTRARQHDSRQRYCLVGLLLLLVVTNAVQGLRSARTSAEVRRIEFVLTEFYKSLLLHTGVEAQILVTDRSAPHDVEFIVRMARPDLALESTPNWSSGMARAAELMSETKRSVLIIDWRTIDNRTTKPLEDKLDIESQFKPTMIHGRRLAAFLLTRRIQPP